MGSKVAMKMLQYKVADSLDKVRLPNNPRALITKENNAVCIKFNRPRFLNCLDASVIMPVSKALSEVIRQGNSDLLLFEGSKAGKKLYSFTTGGDLLMGRNIIRRHEKYNRIAESERLYLVNIYRTQHYISRLKATIPVISLINGAAMGSGTLFGLNSTWSVVTERSLWSLPEVMVAGMPDVGSLYHMGKLPNELGTMLALTGYRLTSTSILHAGLATHFCKSELLQGLRKELLECNGDEKRIQEVLDKYQSNSVNNAKEVINHDAVHQLAAKCNSVYNSDDMREILHNLNMMNNEWSQHQLSLIGKACPLSLKVSLRLLRELQKSKADYDTSLERSYMVAGNIYFFGQMREGIENVMVHRGKKMAAWKMKKLEDVPDSLVDFMFENRFKEQILTLDQIRELNMMKPY